MELDMRVNESSHIGRRIALAFGAAACLVVATVGTVDPGVPVAAPVRTLAVLVGLAVATGIAWALARARGASMTRDAMIPWWALGASVSVLTAAAMVVPLTEHFMFVTVTVLRAGLAALGCRFAADALLGPLPEVPWWADEDEWIAVEQAALRGSESEAAD
jgi:hypothetical protein